MMENVSIKHFFLVLILICSIAGIIVMPIDSYLREECEVSDTRRLSLLFGGKSKLDRARKEGKASLVEEKTYERETGSIIDAGCPIYKLHIF